jgi:hypothetical protein
VTREIVAFDPENWVSIGSQRLSGVSEEIELFTFAKSPIQPRVNVDRIELKPAVKN